ncbi:MAG: hypothetical protein RLZZ196_2976 [Bacteroidota bacterium]|jgi:hypothetical protein
MEKINVEKLIKELSKGDLQERANVLQFLIDWLSKEIDERQQKLSQIKDSLK